jgi:hypothetical protein
MFAAQFEPPRHGVYIADNDIRTKIRLCRAAELSNEKLVDRLMTADRVVGEKAGKIIGTGVAQIVES